MQHQDDEKSMSAESESPVHCGTGRTRLFVEADLMEGQDLVLDPSQSHHLCVVLRARQGERVLLFNGRDGEWQAEILVAHKKSARLTLEKQTRPQIEGGDIWLLFAPIKRAPLDFLVEKATEMGASLLLPVLTQRTNVGRVNRDRMMATVREAAEQCGLLGVPEIGEPQSLDALLANWERAMGDRKIVFCDEWAAPGSTLATLQALREEMSAPPPLALLVGPEGGFSPKERERLADKPYVRGLSIGPRILRAETAAIAALAALQMVLGDWSKPNG